MWPGSSAPRTDGTASSRPSVDGLSSPSRSDGLSSRSPAAAAFAAAAAHARNSITRPSPALASAALPVKAPGFVPASPPQVVTAPPVTPIKKKKKKTIAIIDNVDSSTNAPYYASSSPLPAPPAVAFAPYTFAYPPSVPASPPSSSCPSVPSFASNSSTAAYVASSGTQTSLATSSCLLVSQSSSTLSSTPTLSSSPSTSIAHPSPSPTFASSPSSSYPAPSLASSIPSSSQPLLPVAASSPSSEPNTAPPVPIQSNVLTPADPSLLGNSLSHFDIVQIPSQAATASAITPTSGTFLPAVTMRDDACAVPSESLSVIEAGTTTSPPISPLVGVSALPVLSDGTSSPNFFPSVSNTNPSLTSSAVENDSTVSHSSLNPQILPSDNPTSSLHITSTTDPHVPSPPICVPAVTPVRSQLQPPHASVVPSSQIADNHDQPTPPILLSPNGDIPTLPSITTALIQQQSMQPAILSSESHFDGATKTTSFFAHSTTSSPQITTTRHLSGSSALSTQHSAASVAIVLSPPVASGQSIVLSAPLSSSSATSTGISSSLAPSVPSILPLTLSPSASNSALITQPYSPASVPLHSPTSKSTTPSHSLTPNAALRSPVISAHNGPTLISTSPGVKPLLPPTTLTVSSPLPPVSSTNSLSSPVSMHLPSSTLPSPNSSQTTSSPVSDTSSSLQRELQAESSESGRESSGGDGYVYSKHLPEKTPMVSEFVLREALGQKDRIMAEREEQYSAKLQAAQRKHQDELQELTAKMSNLVQTHAKRGQSLQTELQKEQEETRKLRLALSKEQAQREADEQASAQRLKDLTQQLHLLKSQLLGEISKAPIEDGQKQIARMTNQLMVAETEVLEARDELETSAKELRRVREIILEERELRGQLEQQLEQIKSLFEQESKQLQLRTSSLQEKDAAIDRLQKYLKELELECQGALKSASNLSARVTKDKEFAIIERDRYFAQVQKLELSLQKQAERFEQESKRVTKAYEESLAKQLATADKLLLKKTKAWRAETEATREKQEATLLELKKAVETERAQSTQLIARQEETIATLSTKLAKFTCQGDLQTLISKNALIAEVELRALDEELHAVRHGPTVLRGEALRAELKDQQEELSLQYQSLETDQETQTAMRAEVVNIQSQMDHIRDNKGRDLVLESVVALNQMQETLEEKIRQKEAEVERLRTRVSELEASCKRQAELEEAEATQMQRRTGFLQRSREGLVREQRLWQIVNQHGVVAEEEAGEEHILKILETLLGLSTLRLQVLAERREYDFDRERKIDSDEEARRMQYEGGLLELREMLAKAHNGKQKLAMQSASTIEELKRMLTSVEAQLEHNRAQQDKGKWWNFHFRDKKKE